MRVLVVGSGIAGLGAARELSRAGRDVLVVESRPRPGGYAFSVRHDAVSVDPGFGVFGAPTYPRFMALLAEIGVVAEPLCPFDEYVTRWSPGDEAGWNTLAAIPYARHVVAEMQRFIREGAPRVLASPELDGVSAGAWLEREGYSKEFLRYAWLGGLIVGYGGHPLAYYLGYPIRDLIQRAFLPGTRHPMLRLAKGAAHYVDRLVAALEATGHVELRCGVRTEVVARDGEGVTARIDGVAERFSALVLTPMPAHALGVLGAAATGEERAVLGAFRHSDDEVLVHRHAPFLPARRHPRSFAFLQVRRPGEPGPDYAIATRRWRDNEGTADGFVTHDYRAEGTLRPEGALRIEMPHVRYEVDILGLRARVAAMQGANRTWFAGGHLRGQMLHEDALVTGYDAAAGVLGRSIEVHAREAPLPVAAFADVLRRRPDSVLLGWLDVDANVVDTRTPAQLDAESRAVARALRARGLRKGDRALLAYLPGLEFVSGLLGCLRAGVVAVPVYPPPPTGGPGAEAFARVAADCDATVALTSARFQLPALLAGVRVLAKGRFRTELFRWIATDRLPLEPGGEDAELSPDDPAVLQYTSGSTADPRGVVITHGNLRHQVEAVSRTAVGLGDDTVGFWWVPQYHDLGLISGICASLAIGARSYMASPLDFLRRPALWMEGMSRLGATHTAAPDFAFALCARRTTPEERASLDLSRVRVLMSAGEPIRAANVDAFLAAYAPAGLRPEAICPAYGLAEHTVGVTVGGRRTLHVDPVALGETGRAVPGNHALVGCGPPVRGVSVRIVRDGTVRGPGEGGEILVQSASKAAGYWARSDRDTFGAEIPGEAGTWLRTGDEGFLLDGELFVTGRLKDMVIVRGRNVYPQDVEATVEAAAGPRVKAGRVAAFGEADADLVVVAEVRDAKESGLGTLAGELAAAVGEAHGVAATIVLVPPGAVPRTTSGKIQRRKCHTAWQAGGLQVLARHSAAATETTARPPEERTIDRLLRVIYEQTRLRLSGADTLDAMSGLDSMGTVELSVAIERTFDLPPTWFTQAAGGTLADLADDIDRLRVRADPAPLLRAGEGPPLFVAGPLFLGLAALRPLVSALSNRTVYGLPDDGADDALTLARAHVARVRAVAPDGPVFLAGYSVGGAVVHLLARLLMDAGRAPAAVFLLDPQRPVDAPDPRDLGRVFARSVSAEEDDALEAFRKLVDPAADTESFDRYLQGRGALLASLCRPETVALGERALDVDAVLFRAMLPRPADPAPWRAVWPRLRVVDVPFDHYGLLRGVAAIAAEIEGLPSEAVG